jgi:murein DD-endopeptidase MepM/ murein hydrolase activator NlpD
MKYIVAALLIIGAILSGKVQITTAQEGVQPASGGTTVHVVQRDETLYRIALRYGTTIEAIAEANGISDPRYIAVGQRLLIPNAQFNAPGALITHQVMPGESLDRLAAVFQTTMDQIASANFITNPALIYAGQDLTIRQGTIDQSVTESTDSRTLHRVLPGETLPAIAVKYNVRLNKLLDANDSDLIMPVFPNQRLWIPRAAPDADATDLPLPLTSYTITPIPAVQGQTISLQITTIGPATLSGTFMGYPIQFVTQDANQHFALFGIHAFAASGVFPMPITILEPDGTQTAFTERVRVDEGGYGTEAISLDTQLNDLLNPQVTEPEWERVATMMSAFTSQRYFEGLMGLPSTGAITSRFGTRRTYNGGTLDSFHSGTDFAGGPGSSVVAPAAGVVVLAEELPVRGNATIIDHGWGVVTGYWHQSEIYVNVGDVVTAGQIIGTVGSTGRSTGPHLHWEMWIGGVQVDPMQWVQQSFP